MGTLLSFRGRAVQLALAFLLGAGLLGAATGVYASIPDGGGVVHGCYQKITGALRVIDPGKGQKCSGTELGLTWSQAGPPGVTGQQGPTGQRGPTGDNGQQGLSGMTGATGPSGAEGATGPSNGYFDHPNIGYAMGNPGENIVVTLAQLSLPAGSFVATAKAYFVNTNSGDGPTGGSRAAVRCFLDANGVNVDETIVTLERPWDGSVYLPTQTPVTLTSAFTFADPNALAFKCVLSSNYGDGAAPNVTAAVPSLTVTKVQTLTTNRFEGHPAG